jgi:hypothetical protein
MTDHTHLFMVSAADGCGYVLPIATSGARFDMVDYLAGVQEQLKRAEEQARQMPSPTDHPLAQLFPPETLEACHTHAAVATGNAVETLREVLKAQLLVITPTGTFPALSMTTGTFSEMCELAKSVEAEREL